MKLVKIVREHLTTLQNDGEIAGYTYTWSNQADNILGLVSVWPHAILLTPIKWGLEIDTATAREHGVLQVYFLTPQARLDFNAVENEQLIDGMTDAAVALLAILKHDKRIKVTKVDVEAQSLYDVNSRNLTGVVLSLSLKEQQGRCLDL